MSVLLRILLTMASSLHGQMYVHADRYCKLATLKKHATFSTGEPVQKDDVVDDLDSSMEEFQAWVQEMDTGLRDLQRDLGKLDRDVLSKKQLIEANKAQYTRVSMQQKLQLVM